MAATFVLIFVLFGAFLEVTGAENSSLTWPVPPQDASVAGRPRLRSLLQPAWVRSRAPLSPMRVGFYVILTICVVAGLRAGWRFAAGTPTVDGSLELCRQGVEKVLQALALGARNAVAVSMACAVAGVIVGVVGLAGLGLKFSAMMIAFSGSNIVLALLLVVIASLVLAMGLPVTAASLAPTPARACHHRCILAGPASGGDRCCRNHRSPGSKLEIIARAMESWTCPQP